LLHVVNAEKQVEDIKDICHCLMSIKRLWETWGQELPIVCPASQRLAYYAYNDYNAHYA